MSAGHFFTCPRCGSHAFRTEGHTDDGVALAAGYCHGPLERVGIHQFFGGCDFMWWRRFERMPFTKAQLRVPATILSIEYGVEDHGCNCAWINLEVGGHQAFGGLLASAERAKKFVLDVAAIFDTSDLESLIGRRCIALYSESPHGIIRGIEAESGKRFTMRAWLRAQGDDVPGPQELTRRALMLERDRYTRQIQEIDAQLATIGTIVDWSEEP